MKKNKPCNFYNLPHIDEYMLYAYLGGRKSYHQLFPLDPSIKPFEVIETPPIMVDIGGNLKFVISL